MPIKFLTLSELPPFQTEAQALEISRMDKSRRIAYFFDKLIKHYCRLPGDYLMFPNLNEMTVYFQSSHFEVMRGINGLNYDEYQYMMKGLDAPLTFWRKPKQVPTIEDSFALPKTAE